MATILCPIDPVSDGYTFTPADEMVEVALEGGPARRRRDFVSNTQTVNAQWVLDRFQYTVLMGFFRELGQMGAQAFRVNLLTDANIVMPHICHVSGTLPRLTQQRGHAFWVSGTLEVTPNPIRSYNVILQVIAGVHTVLSNVAAFLPGAANMDEFPAGRDVLLTGTGGTSLAGDVLNLDGTYEIATSPGGGVITLADATVVNPDWVTLATTVPYIHVVPSTACILIPE